MEHCRDCLKIIFRQGFKQEEFVRLIEASKLRLFRSYFPVRLKLLVYLNKKERASLIETFEKKIVALSEAENKPSLKFSYRTNV